MAGWWLGSRPVGGATAAPPIQAKAKSVIQIFLWGGMSHIDTWDPKPDAGYDYNGPMKKPLATNVDGIMVSEWFPNLAKQKAADNSYMVATYSGDKSAPG